MVSTGPVEKRALAVVSRGERREGLKSDGRLKRNGYQRSEWKEKKKRPSPEGE